eukprot:1382169-Pyramimonas_sp.AAC.1
MAPKMFQETPRPPQDGSKRPKSVSTRPRRGQSPPNTQGESMRVAFAFSRPMAIRGLEMAPR